jgi:hypothetical protein
VGKRNREGGFHLCLCRKGGRGKFLKRNPFLFFRALKLGQIQMKFEFNLKQPSPTLNQKQEASA